MGLSASQSRLLTLTSRLSDLELKAQKIQHQKVRLAEQSTEAAKKYMAALDAQDLMFNSAEKGKVPGSVENITASEMYRIADANGNYFYRSERLTNTSQTVTTSLGNTLKINSNGTVTYSSSNNTTTFKGGVISTTTANGTVLADGNGSATDKKPIYVSANRNITVMGGNVTKYSDPQAEVIATDTATGNTTTVTSTAVTKKFINGDKTYSYSVTNDNVLNFDNCSVSKDVNGVYTIETMSGKFITVETANNSFKTTGSVNGKNTSLDGAGASLGYQTVDKDNNKVDGSISVSVSNGNLRISDGSAYYTITTAGKLTITDGGTTVTNNNSIPAYHSDAGLILDGNSKYTVDKKGMVYSEANAQATNKKIVIGIDSATTTGSGASKIKDLDTFSDYDFTENYGHGSVVEYSTITLGEQTGQALTIRNNVNQSSVTALSNGVKILDKNNSGEIIETKIFKQGNQIIIEEGNNDTYRININETEHSATLTSNALASDLSVKTIAANTWVMKNDKTGSFKEVANNNNMSDPKWLLEQLQSASLFIQKYDSDSKYWGEYSYISSSLFTTEDNDAMLAQAEAKYEAETAEIQHKDKSLDLELDNIETEHTAVDTQIEQVKNVVEKSIDKTFKLFG